jgi:RNase P subunit RPR2
MELADDGTLDTVVTCTGCGERMRYDSLSLVEAAALPDDASDDALDDARVTMALDWAEREHEC